VFTFQIPSDGSSVPTADFAKVADEAAAKYRETHQEAENDVEYGQLEAAVSAAKVLVKAGHVGEDNVYVVIGGNYGSALGAAERSLSIGVHSRPAPVVRAPAPTVAVLPTPVSPYYTGAKPDEIARESAATGDSIEATATKLGAPVPAVAIIGAEPAKKAAKPAAIAKSAAIAAKAAKLAVVDPYDAGSVKASDLQSKGTPSVGSSAALGQVAGPAKATPSEPSKAAKAAGVKAAASPTSLPRTQTPQAAATAQGSVPQSNPQTAKPAAGSMEQQVAKDRAGKS
jgi:hypothetical protein